MTSFLHFVLNLVENIKVLILYLYFINYTNKNSW